MPNHIGGLSHVCVLLYPVVVLLFEHIWRRLTARNVKMFEVVHKYMYSYLVIILCSLSRINTM